MPTGKPRVTITMSEEQLEKVENYWHSNKMKNQTQAILSLLDAGLSDLEKKKTPRPYSDEALQLAKDYDALDTWGQKQVRSTAAIEKARCTAEGKRAAVQIDIDAEVDSYRAELEFQKKAEDESSAFDGRSAAENPA